MTKLYESAVDDIDEDIDEDEHVVVVDPFYDLDTAIMIREKIANMPSINTLPICEYLKDLLENRCKFLIFAHHIEVLDAI